MTKPMEISLYLRKAQRRLEDEILTARQEHKAVVATKAKARYDSITTIEVYRALRVPMKPTLKVAQHAEGMTMDPAKVEEAMSRLCGPHVNGE